MGSLGVFIGMDAERGGCTKRIHPVVLRRRAVVPDYWTVTEPFMFIAACGVQMKSYLPAGTLANETT